VEPEKFKKTLKGFFYFSKTREPNAEDSS